MAMRELAPVFQYTGAAIGFNPQDHFMMTLGNTLVVVTQDGSGIFGADVVGRNIGPVFRFTGAAIGFKQEDHFMMTLGNTLVVVRTDGAVFGADVVGDEPITFDSGPLTSDLPLGGSVHIVIMSNGDFTFSSHAHDSGFDNIHYVITAALVAPSGM